MIISTNAENNHLTKIKHPCKTKMLNKLGIEGNYPNMTKGIMKNSQLY